MAEGWTRRPVVRDRLAMNLIMEWLVAPFLEFSFMRRALVACLALGLGCGSGGGAVDAAAHESDRQRHVPRCITGSGAWLSGRWFLAHCYEPGRFRGGLDGGAAGRSGNWLSLGA